jgi:hypothetical protein
MRQHFRRQEGILRIERRWLARPDWKTSRIKIAVWAMLHTANGVNVWIAVPEIRLNVDHYGGSLLVGVVALAEKLQRKSAVDN